MTNKSTTASSNNSSNSNNNNNININSGSATATPTPITTTTPPTTTTTSTTSESNNNTSINNNNNNNNDDNHDLRVREESKLVASGVGPDGQPQHGTQPQPPEGKLLGEPPPSEAPLQSEKEESTASIKREATNEEQDLEKNRRLARRDDGSKVAAQAEKQEDGGVKLDEAAVELGGQPEAVGASLVVDLQSASEVAPATAKSTPGEQQSSEEPATKKLKLDDAGTGDKVSNDDEIPSLVIHTEDGGPVPIIHEQEIKLEPPPAQVEYTMLTPATLASQGQPAAASATTATILTDLDAANAAGAERQASATNQTNQQDGSSTLTSDSTTTTPIKIEHHLHQQQQLGAGTPPCQAPLTELAPAAVVTTFSELTSVNPMTVHELQGAQPQQQLHHQHLNLQQHHHLQHPGQNPHHDQLQHQHDQVIHHHPQAAGLASESYLITGHEQQHHHHMMVAAGDQQQSHLGAYSLNSQSPFLVGSNQAAAGTDASQQAGAADLLTRNSLNQSSNSNQGDSSQASLATAGGEPRPFSQTTGPPSVSSIATEASGSVAGGGGGGPGAAGGKTAGSTTSGGGGKRRAWSQMNRQVNKTEIAKVYSPQGFRCYLEAPISTCRRKEEDRITYINKGEFYGLTLDYVPDPQRPIRSNIVKAVIMLVFREDKSLDEDMKSWQFWHSRQHSAKQRILDVDNKNHVNVINQIEEVSLNAIAFYWNPIETRQAKLNIAIQCLSTDFSNQKGVKGLPMNLQVDIYDLFTETSTPVYRAYATLLSYCDKGAQRRSRDEERRALKRKLTDQAAAVAGAATAASGASAAKKFEDLYHKPCDRSEFYAMADLVRAPTLYNPSEQEALGLAASEHSTSSSTGGGGGGKQPMSQASVGLSVTPIAATTPIPTTAPAASVAARVTPVPPGAAVVSQPTAAAASLLSSDSVITPAASATTPSGYVAITNPAAPGQGGILSATRTGSTPRQSQGPFSLSSSGPAVVGHAPGPYGTIITADYMTAAPHVVAGVGGTSATMIPAGPTGMVSMSPIQQQQQSHLISGGQMVPTSQQQNMHQMQGQMMQQQHHQPHHLHPMHHQHQQQQHQPQYHTMTSGNNQIQPSYGILQTPSELQHQQQQQQQQQQQHIQQHQQQQYAVLQPSSGAQQSHLSHAHNQQQQQQQQIISQHQHHHQQSQQQHPTMDPTRPMGAQVHHRMVMGGAGAMAQQQHQQQQQQQQQQHQQQQMQHAQYGQPTTPSGNNLISLQTPTISQQQQQQQQQLQPFSKRSKLYPDERVLIYAKQADEKDFYPLHLSPPSLSGLVFAIEQKYKIDSTKIANIYKKSKKGIRVQMDDEMIRHYCNEDMVQLEVIQTSDSRLEITLVEM